MLSLKKTVIISMLFIGQLQANNWEFKQKLTASNSQNYQQLGIAIALSGDGKILVAGAPLYNENSGTAFVFQKQPNDNWQQDGPALTVRDKQGAQILGWSTSISDDGSRIAIGGWGDNNQTGAVWLFERINGETQPLWQQTGPKLVGTNSIGLAQQGRSVALSGDGKKLAIGASGDNNTRGAVWLYEHNGTNWNEGPKIISLDTDAQAAFGGSVALSYDGNILAVGACRDNNDAGAVVMYKCAGNICKQDGKKIVARDAEGSAKQGRSVALSDDGKTLAFGGYLDNTNIGATWVYTYTSQWIQQGKKLVGSDYVDLSNQGHSIALSRDGNVLLVGGYSDNVYSGAAWKFIRTDGSQWSQDGEKIADLEAHDAWQGYSVALSSDGNTAAISIPGDQGYVGAVQIYGIPDSSSSRETYMTYWLPPLLAIAAGLITFGLKYIIKKHCCRTTDAPMSIKLNEPFAMLESASDRRSSFA